jgi:hypothetical protein
MSALPPKADIRQRIEHVCFVPEADYSAAHPILIVTESGLKLGAMTRLSIGGSYAQRSDLFRQTAIPLKESAKCQKRTSRILKNPENTCF